MTEEQSTHHQVVETTTTVSTTEEKQQLKPLNAKKLAKQQRLQQRKAHQKASKKQEVYVSWEDINNEKVSFGCYPLIQSNISSSPWIYTSIGELSEENSIGKDVTVRARVHNSRNNGRGVFLLLRQGIYSIQATCFVNENVSLEMVKFLKTITKETVIDVIATVTKVPKLIESATQQNVELTISKLFVVSRAGVLPLLVEDCMRSAATEEDQAKLFSYGISQENRLNNRVIDMRAPAHLSIFKIQNALGRFFREFLYTQDFTEIHTPKLIPAASEGGSAVFEVNYFSGKAYLAQSNQLYKQMAVMGDLTRVFEIGPVFRAEHATTHRHLTEFVGLDIEMAIEHHYEEVVDMADKMFIHIFNSIEQHFAQELRVIQTQYPFEPLAYSKTRNLRITYPEAIALLRQDGVEIEDLEDLTTPNEKRLGRLVKAKYNTDFFFLEKFPAAARAFYTMPCPEDERYSNSFDIFLRGEEISSGAQRIHDPELLVKNIERRGITVSQLQSYIDAFKYGAFPHGGYGIGLERVTMLYLSLGNVRKTSMFPRDPRRLTP
jgi:nondiscriminating aspartyl-tRNA synthetase